MTTGSVIAIVAAGFFGVVFIIGIIAAIAIPNLLNAIQRGKQVRTMADMRAIGTAIEAYAEDNKVLPAVDSMSKLGEILSPKYIRQLPIYDAWQQEFRYVVSDPTSETRRYIVISSGKDGVLDHADPQLYTPTPVQSFNNDLVFSGGEFIRYPEGRSP